MRRFFGGKLPGMASLPRGSHPESKMALPVDSEGDGEMISGINVTPLVDITLVLLIIFMVTATYIVKETIEVDLPRAANGGESVGVTLNVVMDRQGLLYLDGVQVSENALISGAKAAAGKDPEVRAIISADESARHGAVVHVIDLVKGAGVARFAINIEKDALAAASSSPPAGKDEIPGNTERENNPAETEPASAPR